MKKGQFPPVDIIGRCLAASGPADATISTWTAAGADLGFAYELVRHGAIRSLRFIVDFSFPTRQPEYCAALRERFGDECIRVTKTHAKFCMIRNEEWNLVIRSSMNLNENRRPESFEISDDRALADFLDGLVGEIFATAGGRETLESRPFDNCKRFESLFSPGTVTSEAAMLASTDVRKYFGSGRHDADRRRPGVSRC